MDKSQITKIKKQIQPAVKKYLETNKRAIAKNIVQNAKSNNATGLVKVKSDCLNWVAKTIFNKPNGFDFNNQHERELASLVLTVFDLIGNSILIPIVQNIIKSTKIGDLVADLNVKIIANYVIKKNDPTVTDSQAILLAQNVFLIMSGYVTTAMINQDNSYIYNKIKGQLGSMLFAIGAVAAFNEESSKATANKLGFLKDYLIMFNVVEFTWYVTQAIGYNLKSITTIIPARLLAVVAHIVFGLCHKLGVGWLGYILHAVWNTFSIAISSKMLVQKG